MPSDAVAPLAPEILPAADNVVPIPVGDRAGAVWQASSPEDLTFVAVAPCDVQALVEAPCRALEVEYKSWRNLDHAEDRAELARDIAALANHGGGFIVFGFDERSLAPDETDPFRTDCTSERVASIVRGYLDPPVHCEVLPMFRCGWNMFDPPYRRAVQARFVVDPASGEDETDFLEAAWLLDRIPGETADFWRVSPRGMATVIRGYAEDMTQLPPLPPIRPGTCLSPATLAQGVAELVCHARAFARLFSAVRRVAFRCEWWGLSDRELFDGEARWAHRGPATDDRRVATALVPLALLGQAWPEVVAMLIAPVLRAFEPDLVLDAEWVRAQAPNWAR